MFLGCALIFHFPGIACARCPLCKNNSHWIAFGHLFNVTCFRWTRTSSPSEHPTIKINTTYLFGVEAETMGEKYSNRRTKSFVRVHLGNNRINGKRTYSFFDKFAKWIWNCTKNWKELLEMIFPLSLPVFLSIVMLNARTPIDTNYFYSSRSIVSPDVYFVHYVFYARELHRNFRRNASTRVCSRFVRSYIIIPRICTFWTPTTAKLI